MDAKIDGFQPLSALLAKALPPTDDAPAAGTEQRRLLRRWRAALTAAGLDAAADHCQPLLFAERKLVVFVANAAFGNEVRHRAQRLTDALAADGVRVDAVEVKVVPAVDG